MKAIHRCNMVFIISILLFWMLEILKCFSYNSTLMNMNEIPKFIIVILVIGAFIVYVIYSFFSKPLCRYTVIVLFSLSVGTIILLYESIYFYLPWNHNEQFIFNECALIYLAVFSLVWLLLLGIKKIKGDKGDGSCVS